MQTQSGPLNMAVKLLVLFLLLAVVRRTDGACNFPSALTGVWTSSRWRDVTFTSTQMAVTGITNIGSVTFECEILSGSLYILSRSEFHVGRDRAGQTRLPSSTVTTAIACDVSSPYAAGTNHVLVKKGSEELAAAQCPDPLLATFDNYTIDLGSGAQCNNNGYINVCNDYKNVSIDYSVCATKVFYSGSGGLECLYYSTSGSTYYVNLYNFDATVDDSTTYRFACVAIQYGSGSGDYVYATQNPTSCHSGQTATSVNTGGGTLQLSPNVPSTPASSSGSSVGIIVAVIILLLIIILVALAVYHLWYRKRWPVVKEKLPCLKGRSKGQVDPCIDEEDAKPSSAPADAAARPYSASQPAVVATAVVTDEDMKRLQSSQSSRSVATPSHLQTEVTSEGATPAPAPQVSDQPTANPTPRRLPPLETTRTGESHYEGIRLDGVPVEPVYLRQQRAAPLETTRLSEESESSDAVSIPPRLPPTHHRRHEPLYQNM